MPISRLALRFVPRLIAGALLLTACRGGPPAASPAPPVTPLASTCDLGWRPPPTFPTGIEFASVDMRSAAEAWVVGDQIVGASDRRAVAARWDGDTWRVTAGLPEHGSLAGIDAVADDNVWAVGSQPKPGADSQVLIVHWDGTAWQTVPAPELHVRFAVLDAVRFSSASDGWAVGAFSGGAGRDVSTLTLHYDGTRWRVVPSPTDGYHATLYGVLARSEDDAQAVGGYQFQGEAGFFKALILRWDGKRWIREDDPAAGVWGTYADITSDGRAQWAVGRSFSGGRGPNGSLVSRDEDGGWTRVPVTGLTTRNNRFGGVAIDTRGSVWVVGSYETTLGSFRVDRTLALRYDRGWRVVPTPNVGEGDNNLRAVASAGGTTIAVGNRTGEDSRVHPIVLVSCQETRTP